MKLTYRVNALMRYLVVNELLKMQFLLQRRYAFCYSFSLAINERVHVSSCIWSLNYHLLQIAKKLLFYKQ